jgi:hypothetical protein
MRAPKDREEDPEGRVPQGTNPFEAGPGEFIFSFHDIRGAIVGERRLLDAGLPVTVMPTPPQIGPGCGICLRVGGGDLEKVCTLLGTEYRGIFRRAAAGGGFIRWNP